MQSLLSFLFALADQLYRKKKQNTEPQTPAVRAAELGADSQWG